ncbi:AAA family ATPase [Mangrovimonas sp. YM274]|uniref:AAA family ATPase n=1 Tax=Mangrovimonas sp. YM274 TaxID=3070660 RepID=UPI0027DD60D0|nr:ATP-binding protein [Mangrovimonas sp. YM274]WMI70273.1 AAA family ATPase [Mangrovimonas sp. YM274]
MYINKIIIKKFRHLENECLGPFNFNNKSSELTVFAGPNGSGKSSVLELIGYALSSSYSLGWSLSRTFNGFSFEIAIGLSPEEKKIIIDSLKTELESIEKTIKEGINSIDIKEGLTPEVKETQKEQFIERTKRPHKHQYDILDYLKTNDVYYRAFEYNSGEYAKDSTLHNQIHSYVTRELKDKLKRSLGFFLRADRNYPQKGFDRKKIFSFDNVKRKEHLWQMAFNTSEIQYLDMYEFLVQQRYHYLRELGNYYNQKNKGIDVGDEPADPIRPYETLLNQIFPDYKFADKNESIPSNLFIELPSKEVITFNDLSSGEKEVFFILSFFIRHNVENAIIVIDEPELHLHPELSRLLIRNIKSIRNGNQIWVATHNSEIIDEAGRDRVVYVARDLSTRKAKFVSGDNEEDVIIQLKNLFGYSGYIGVAKNLVFLEGDNSSPDRKFYSTLFPKDNSNFKLIPSSGSDNLTRINGAILSIMDANLGWMNFYLIRDRDYLTPDMVSKYRAHSSGKVFVLEKHEIENYLLDLSIIGNVLGEIFNINKSEQELKDILFKAALKISSQVVRDMISFRLNLNLKPQDFSIGKVLNGDAYFEKQDSECLIKKDKSQIIKNKFTKTSDEISDTLTTALSSSEIETIISDCESEVKESLENDGWLSLFPGKELLETLAKELGITNLISFQNSIIKEFASNHEKMDNELIEIFNKINEG